jgi:hypothetical protein
MGSLRAGGNKCYHRIAELVGVQALGDTIQISVQAYMQAQA